MADLFCFAWARVGVPPEARVRVVGAILEGEPKVKRH